MTGRGARTDGHGGPGNGGRGRGRGHGQNYTGTPTSIKKGLCDALGANVFDYGQKSSADQMRTSWEKITEYVGTSYGQDISNELQNKSIVTLPEPTHSTVILQRNAAREAVLRAGQINIQAVRRVGETMLQAAVVAALDPRAPMELATLQNEIANSEMTQNINAWRTYRERTSSLAKHQGQTYSLILGQCSQLLKDKMKQDIGWTTVSVSYDPLILYRLIEKSILAQTEDQYPFATVYDQELSFYQF
jgi:hypothetical protein